MSHLWFKARIFLLGEFHLNFFLLLTSIQQSLLLLAALKSAQDQYLFSNILVFFFRITYCKKIIYKLNEKLISNNLQWQCITPKIICCHLHRFNFFLPFTFLIDYLLWILYAFSVNYFLYKFILLIIQCISTAWCCMIYTIFLYNSILIYSWHWFSVSINQFTQISYLLKFNMYPTEHTEHIWIVKEGKYFFKI